MVELSGATVVTPAAEGTAYRNRAIEAAEIPPLTGSVNNQAKIMFRNNDQSTLSLERTRPTNTMEPTLQCVLLTGIPTLDANSTVRAAPISMENPLKPWLLHVHHTVNNLFAYPQIYPEVHFQMNVL